MKLLLWTIIAVLVVMWLMRSKKEAPQKGTSTGPTGRRSHRQEIEPMVKCAECGVYIPASEALPGPSDKVFCSDEHRLRHAQSR
jgi:uncharacterized protein